MLHSVVRTFMAISSTPCCTAKKWISRIRWLCSSLTTSHQQDVCYFTQPSLQLQKRVFACGDLSLQSMNI